MQPKDMNNSKGFKLIAIRPLKNCAPHFLKVLVEGEIYKFYNEYEFKRKDENDIHSDVESIEYKNTLLENLYDLGKDKPTINISAVVGKNGSGKSTLFELLFALIYLVFSKEMKGVDKSVFNSYKDALRVEIYFLSEGKIYVLRYNLSDDVSIIIFPLKKGKEKIIFNNPKKIVCSQLSDKKVKNNHIQKFFYSIVINYSLYSLNSRIIGHWIDKLFHKNDGYQLPASINPFRIEGNIDVNSEHELVKGRLLSNILTLGEKDGKKNNLLYAEIVENKFVVNLRLTKNDVDEHLDQYVLPNSITPEAWFIQDTYSSEKKLFELIYSQLIEKSEGEVGSIHKPQILNYIIKKLYKIAKVYQNDYGRFLSKVENKGLAAKFNEDGENSFENYLDEIKKDKSHITFKVYQAVNYLKNPFLEDLNWKGNTNVLEITPQLLAEKIEKIKIESDIIYHLPPPIFDINLYVKDVKDESSNGCFLSEMSSGEQQLIHTIQSIFYHLRNINSVYAKNENSERITYSNINIMLDEIELYFHPDYQREFIKKFLGTIKKLDVKNGIKNINILFSTHSPFILSDIPVQNTLRLKRNKDKGKAEIEKNSKQTFGANIHDLLHDSFFMNDGFMGEFAKNEIRYIIDFLSHKIGNKKSFENTKKWTLEDARNRIDIIGESVLRKSLVDLYNEAIKNSIEEIQKEIDRLTELKKLRSNG